MKQKRLKFSARTIIIVIAMLFTCIGVSAQENTCIVAGNQTSIFGSSWNGQDENNKMVKGNDGKYRKDYTVNKAYKIVQLKVVDGENWIGDANGNNIEFKLTGAGTFTVVFDPNNNNISVTGSIVQTITKLEYTTVYVAGNGEDEWLNGVYWTTNAPENKMTEIEPGLWIIKFYGVPRGYERQVKFAIDGEWTFNFGGTFEDFGTWSDADYNGSPITFNTDDCDITIILDLRDFDFTTKQGAKFTINIELASNPDDPEPEPNPAATVTTAPTAAENVFAGTNTALVSAGSVSGGTMMYKMTTTNQKPSNVDGFSTTIPTSENITGTCSVYVWYYVKGDNEHSDSEIFGPVTVAVISSADFSVSGNEYTIHTATGWDVFCNMLANNDKGIFSGKTVCLGASFEVSRMAGSDYHDFTGTFDGQGNTLTFNYGENNTPANADCAAPFRNVENGNIQNLHVMGHIYTSAKYAAGFVGKLYGSVNIKNCRSSIVVHSSTSGDGTHGGFVASNGGTLSIEGCVFDGKLLTTGQTATGNCGGFIGWGSGTITNSLYAPAKLDGGEIEVQAGTGDYPSCTFVRNGSAGDNCYYTRLLGTAQGKAPHTVSAGQDVSIGAIALSGKATTYSVSGITAYANGGIKRTEASADTYYYGQGDALSLTLGNTAAGAPAGYRYDTYTASAGTLAADGTLTMPDDDVTITVSTDHLASTGLPVAVAYIDADGTLHDGDNAAQAVALDGSETSLGSNGQETWYFAGLPTVAFDHTLNLTGDVTLILCDGCTMEANGGIVVSSGNSLTIYAQSDGGSMGVLIAEVPTSDGYSAGIGGSNGQSCGTVTINGGDITAKGGYNGAGIGGGAGGSGGTIVINGGTVKAYGNSTSDNHGGGAGIGGGTGGAAGNITINGGTVTAQGNWYVPGIGGGINGTGGNITINGGKVTSEGGYNGDNGINGTITLGWSKPTDRIYASSYSGTVQVADGKKLHNGTDYLGGTLGDPSAAVNGKTLRPAATATYTTADGNTATADAILLDASDNSLPAGNYLATGTLNYTHGITLTGNATLILADGCQMHIGTSKSRINGYGIYGEDLETGNDYDLTITSQSLGTSMGALSVYTTGAYKRGIRPGALTINGGNITADSDGEWAHALTAFNDLTINGGTVRANATGSSADAIFANGNFHYNGGTVTATATYDKAIFVFGKHYTFNWRNPGDRITIGSTGLYAPNDATATFTRLFTDATKSYSGTLTGDELNALKDVTLSPAYDITLLDNADNSATIGADYLDGVTQFVTLQGRTLYKDGAWNTLCLPFDITNAQLDALAHPLHGSKIIELDVESKEEDGVTPKTRLDNDGTLYLYFNSVYDYMMPSEGLKAGKPYLVKWEKLNGYDENPSDFDISDPVFSGVTIDASASTTVNFNGGAFRGTYSPINFEANDKSILFLGAENKLYWPNADMTLKACRAYFQLNNGAEARAIVLNFNDDEDNTTGIAPLLSPEGDDAGASPRGGLVGASWYDLQGRRLSQKPTKAGIYVRNGRKKVLK